MPERQRRQKGLRLTNLAILLVVFVFKWHPGSEGVKYYKTERWIKLQTGTVWESCERDSENTTDVYSVQSIDFYKQEQCEKTVNHTCTYTNTKCRALTLQKGTVRKNCEQRFPQRINSLCCEAGLRRWREHHPCNVYATVRRGLTDFTNRYGMGKLWSRTQEDGENTTNTLTLQTGAVWENCEAGLRFTL